MQLSSFTYYVKTGAISAPLPNGGGFRHEAADVGSKPCYAKLCLILVIAVFLDCREVFAMAKEILSSPGAIELFGMGPVRKNYQYSSYLRLLILSSSILHMSVLFNDPSSTVP